MCCHNNCDQSFTTCHKLFVPKNCTGHKKNRKRRTEECKESKNKEVKKRSIVKKIPDEFLQQKVVIEEETLREEEPEKEF